MKNIKPQKILLAFVIMLCMNAEETGAQSMPRLYELVYGKLSQNVEGKMEYNNADGTKSMNYYNSDYCPYVLSRENDGSYLIRPGKNTLFTVKTGQENPWKTTSSYRYWRGQFIKDFDIMTPYALPVKPGAKVKWEQDRRHRQKTMNFDMEAYDTVYAVRGGTACVCSDDNALLIVHKDNTMSLYITLSDVFIYPGENIEVGQPVGLADYGGVDISWFFLDKNRFEGDVAKGWPYAHFIPYFSTSEGLVQPEENKEYEAVMSDEVATLDMSKSAKKKYLKKKKK
ncbi:MAG: M23 family peptidase [Candidatus Cryptobacteroides sp.]